MTVILMLIFICWFLVMDAIIKPAFIKQHRKPEAERGTYITTPGFEMLGALAQDGGEPVEKQGHVTPAR
jgi:hypothetical protein